jgi:hypothetical protein
MPHYRNSALPSACLKKTHDKVFVECNIQQKNLGEQYIGKAFLPSTFYRRVSLGTRQRKVAVTAPVNGDGAFAKCHLTHSTKSTSLHSTNGPPAGPFVSFFAKCSRSHSAKLASLPSVRATTLGKKVLPVPRCCFSTEDFFAECISVPRALLSVNVVVAESRTLPSAAFGKAPSTRQRAGFHIGQSGSCPPSVFNNTSYM